MGPRFAPVAPLRVLAQLAEEDIRVFGGYHLLIVSEVAKDIFRYGTFFANVRSAHPDAQLHIILDNGVVEAGYAAGAGQMASIAGAIGAQTLVLPDVLGDMQGTIQSAKEGRKLFLPESRFKFMGVVQGTTMNEFMECAHELSGYSDFLAVPRLAVGHIGSRVELVQRIADLYEKPIHLLGFSDNLRDDMEAVHAHELVMGIDSAMPIWMGQEGWDIDTWGTPASHPSKRPETYWRDEVLNEQVIENIRKVRQWVSDAKGAPTKAAPQVPEGQKPAASASSAKPPEQRKSAPVSPSSAPPANSSKRPSSGLVQKKRPS